MVPNQTNVGRSALIVALVLGGIVALPAWGQDAATSTERFDGPLSVIWGDPHPDDRAAPTAVRHVLSTDDGQQIELEISDALLTQFGHFHAWNGRRVAAFLRPVGTEAVHGRRSLAAMRLLPNREGVTMAGVPEGGVSGPQPWVSILCKFSDKSAEPQNQAFFQGMYANAPGGLDHYWREVSYNTINVVGSTAIDWVDLPQPQSFYIPIPGQDFNANLTALFDDCTGAADPFVDYGNGGSPFAGINMMFNDVLDCCAWGGSRFETLDGVTKQWRVTWDPPWAYAEEGVIAHEMGHGFGLPHATNFDDDDFPYDSPWDVMSDAVGYGVFNATYGRLGKHVNAYHKDTLGWIPPGQRFDVPGNGTFQVTLDGMAVASTTNHRIAIVPVSSGRFYTVEARVRTGSYESSLPDDAVIIHEVVLGRSEPSWTVDDDVPPADYGDNAGSRWTVGETFTDASAEISVRVLSATANGFVVEIVSGPSSTLFSDGFESGDLSAWTSTVP